MRSQTSDIAKYLINGRTITAAQAIERFGCYRLSARIRETMDMGFLVMTTTKASVSRSGRTARYAVYSMPYTKCNRDLYEEIYSEGTRASDKSDA